jgi:hypothetical protein
MGQLFALLASALPALALECCNTHIDAPTIALVLVAWYYL